MGCASDQNINMTSTDKHRFIVPLAKKKKDKFPLIIKGPTNFLYLLTSGEDPAIK